MNALLLMGLLALSVGVSGPQTIPAGTILPVRLNTSLSSSKSRPGQQITARVMQAVPLPDGSVIRAGSTLVGHVIRVSGPSDKGGGEIAFQFDSLKTSRSSVSLTVSLRALASFMETEDAQVPAMGADRGTMPAAYTTVQVGNDVVYRGGGPVMNGSEVVGTPVPGGVLVHLRPNPEAGCRGASEGNDRPQALWVFSSDACGAYGLPQVLITRAGRDTPRGEIVLTARSGGLKVPSGTGVLLRVIREGA
jgi:hypothetical protein